MMEQGTSKTHAENMLMSMFKLQQKSYLTDVTIVCKDGLLYAHSVVLAAASSVFMNMLSQCSRGLALNDRTTSDIQNLLVFIYTGKQIEGRQKNMKLSQLQEVFHIKLPGDTNISNQNAKTRAGKNMSDEDISEDFDDNYVSEHGGEHCNIDRDNIVASDPDTPGIESKRSLKPRKKTRSREKQRIKPTKHKRHKRPTSISVRPVCDICGAKIATYRLLIYHKNRKHNVPYSKEDEEKYFYRCDFTGCHYQSHLLNLMKTHKEKVHKQTERTIPCNQCGKMFSNTDALRSHAYRHKMPDVQCHVCGSSVKREYLKGHIKRHHEKQAEFQCSDCDYKCVTKRHFIAHLNKVHNDSSQGTVKMFNCVYCDYSTSEGLPKLMNHINFKHAVSLGMKQKDHICDVCGKGFSCNDYLKNHMVVHTNPDRFKCLHCKYSTSSQTSIDAHVRTQHVEKGSKPWSCEMCGFSVKFRGNLKKHLLHKHKLSEEKAASIMKTVRASGSIPRAAELSIHYTKDPRFVSISKLSKGND